MPPTIPGKYTPEALQNLAGRLVELQGKLTALAALMNEHKVDELLIDYDSAQRLAFSNLNKFITSGYDGLEAFRAARGDYGRPVGDENIPAAAGKSPRNGRKKPDEGERNSKGKGSSKH